MKKSLKFLAIFIGIGFVALVVSVFILIRTLPSSWQIKQALSPQRAQNPEFITPTKPPSRSDENNHAEDSLVQAKPRADKLDDSKALTLQVLREDFMNEKKTLASVCAHLSLALESRFLRNDDSASANEFMKSLADQKKDPVVESAAPLFRYLFRIDSIRDLVETIEKAEADKDESIFKKAEFYTKLGLAGQEMRANKDHLDRLLMKTYNMFMLSRVVAKHPELARDPATLTYCDQIEKNINLNLDFNASEQAAEMQKFLDYAKVNPTEIGYDPSYRSDVKFELGNKSLTMNHIWIERLFARDISKAQKELKEKPQPEPEGSGP